MKDEEKEARVFFSDLNKELQKVEEIKMLHPHGYILRLEREVFELKEKDKKNQQAIEKAVEIIRELGGIVREGVTCHYLVDYGALHRATLFLKEYMK